MRRLSLFLVMAGACGPSFEPLYDEPAQQSLPSTERSVLETPARQVVDVDWDAALQADRLAEPIVVHERVDLPVLLLDHPVSALVQDELWYTASYAFPTHNVVVEGRRVAFSDTVDGEFPEPTWDKPRVTSTHYIFDATFVAWRVSYTVSLECRRPNENPLCADDAAVLAAVKDLKLADSPALKEVTR
jgi:hypothetical protein